LGPVTVHFYALCILLGIVVALRIGIGRYRAAGGLSAELFDLAIYVIPAGIIGGRLYHVITTPELYFGGHFFRGSHGRLADAFKIWEGGMGIWGAVGLGVLTAFIYYRIRPRSLDFANTLDALAPGLLVAQAIGRLGNWFNGELFGGPTTVPWALSIPVNKRPGGYESFSTFHPTFLYEALWCLFVALLLVRLPWIKVLKPGGIFLAYVASYSLGRIWIEALRIDSAHHIFGIRLNDWVASLSLIISLLFIWRRQLYADHKPD
jgi:prolipoprotein diacylglyceryl transferase